MSGAVVRPPARGFPAWAGPEARLRHLLGYAVQAPSRYNAQPWLFEIEGDGLAVFADRRRALRAADPQGREAAIACGAALENARVAAAHHGHAAEVETGQARGVGEPLARLWLGARAAPRLADELLFRAIPLRRSSGSVQTALLPEALQGSLREEAARLGCALRPVPPMHHRALAALAAEADAEQWASPRFRAEQAIWTRPALRTPAPAPARAAGVLGRLLQRFSGTGRELDRRIGAQLAGLLLLSTRGDEPADWVAAGRALQAVLLRAAAAGLEASYLSPPLEVPGVRQRLRRAIFEAGHPQVLLRLGRGTVLRTPRRRPVELVLRAFAPAVEVRVGEESAVEAA
ncbi:MAG: hypothetical protein HZB56_03790 [Deltaproteobacteria bacterium]|nr:hypothetical protein [Deltaproteobacteria bacterium]